MSVSGCKRVRVRVSGRVQGVWFRASTQREATVLGLRGWVRNVPDGCVELVAEGAAQAVDQLLAWTREGPADARVLAVAVEDEPFSGAEPPFEVRY